MTAAETPTLPPAPPSAHPPARSLDAIDVSVLRDKWSQLAGEIGRDLESGDSVNVERSMPQLANLEAYIALVESHQHARRPKWRQWEFWRRVILALAVALTLTLLFMAFTHPARAAARLVLNSSSVVFKSDEAIRLAIGRRFETISVTGLGRVEFPGDAGQRVITADNLIVSNDRQSFGRLDWITIPAGATVRISASGDELSLAVSVEGAAASAASDAALLPAIRWNLSGGVNLSVASESGDVDEQATIGVAGAAASIDGMCMKLPARLEVSILLSKDDPAGAEPLRLSRLSGARISRIACVSDDLVSGERRSTLLGGEIAFPDIEVPHCELDEGALLQVREFSGSLVRVEITRASINVICEGDVSDILLGRDDPRTILPSRLESLFARRFRMYVTGVLLYAIVFIVALLKGEKQSIGEGFRPHALMGMVHGGGHL